MSGAYTVREPISRGDCVFILENGLYSTESYSNRVCVFAGYATEDFREGDEVEVPGPKLIGVKPLTDEQIAVLRTVTPHQGFAYFSGWVSSVGDVPLIYNGLHLFGVISREGEQAFATIEAAVEYFKTLPAVARKPGIAVAVAGNNCTICGWEIPETEVLMKIDEDVQPKVDWIQIIFTCPKCGAEIQNPEQTPLRIDQQG